MTEPEFIEKVEMYQGKILRLCNNILMDRGEAEDAAQETFVKAWTKREQFREQASYLTWLHSIAVNTCLSMKKKATRHIRLLDFTHGTATATEAESKFGDPDVEAAIRKLSHNDRAILYSRAVEEYDFPDIAKMFGISVPAARKRYERAREKFKSAYQADETAAAIMKGGHLNEKGTESYGCI